MAASILRACAPRQITCDVVSCLRLAIRRDYNRSMSNVDTAQTQAALYKYNYLERNTGPLGRETRTDILAAIAQGGES